MERMARKVPSQYKTIRARQIKLKNIRKQERKQICPLEAEQKKFLQDYNSPL